MTLNRNGQASPRPGPVQVEMVSATFLLRWRGPPEKCATVAFTRRDVSRYPLFVQGTQIPYVKHHTFLGIILDRSLSWARLILRLRERLYSFVPILRMLTGKTWGCTVPSLLRLYKALYLGLLRYSLAALSNLSKMSFRAVESVQAQALRTCLGLPRCRSTNGTLCEARCFSAPTLDAQELLSTSLRHVARCSDHPLANASAPHLRSILPAKAPGCPICKHPY